MQVVWDKNRSCRGRSPLAFLYKLGIVLFESRVFLITSDRELRRNRHDIYASNKCNKQKINSTPNSSKPEKLSV
jgi:hypothetical protein